jgi:aconitate hydratase
MEILTIGKTDYSYYNISELQGIEKLPFVYRVILEMLKRTNQVDALNSVLDGGRPEIAFQPARIIMQDYTGVPAVVDLVTLREAVAEGGGDPKKINPIIPVDLVIDHSVQCDFGGVVQDAKTLNEELEYKRNLERYQFLKYASKEFDNFRVFPPDSGIIHQINMEYIASVVSSTSVTTPPPAVPPFEAKGNVRDVLIPDTVFGTDSHTTQVNCLGVLGWGVGGIEAEAAMLGEPTTMSLPEVVGVELQGELPNNCSATDLALTIVEALRKVGVVGKFVEYYGPGLQNLSVADRSVISNMTPEYGATCGYFPIDDATIDYLKLTRSAGPNSGTGVEVVEQYAKANSLFYTNASTPNYSETLIVDLGKVEPSVAGPTRPQDRISVNMLSNTDKPAVETSTELKDDDIVLASITSCTNTSNPYLLIQAGLFAKKALELGYKVNTDKVKTSFSPGSKVVTKYLEDSGLLQSYTDLGFDIVGYGCMTCIGNSGPLSDKVSKQIADNDLRVVGVLSGNRNFPGRINPLIKDNYLMSPMNVMMYALLGNITVGASELQKLVPTKDEVNAYIDQYIKSSIFASSYDTILTASEKWNELEPVNYLTSGSTGKRSSYIHRPPFIGSGNGPNVNVAQLEIAASQASRNDDRIKLYPLAVFGDSITTDHISPAGKIRPDSPAGKYLKNLGIAETDFNSFGARRGNDEVMVRGTFDNIRLENLLVKEATGGYSKVLGSNAVEPIFVVATKYLERGQDTIILAGENYGMGSSRDWAAKGTNMLGVKVVVAKSFERIHRSNLVMMGVLPLTFAEDFDLQQFAGEPSTVYLKIVTTPSPVGATPSFPKGNIRSNATAELQIGEQTIKCKVEVYNEKEWKYFNAGGILNSIVEETLNNNTVILK